MKGNRDVKTRENQRKTLNYTSLIQKKSYLRAKVTEKISGYESCLTRKYATLFSSELPITESIQWEVGMYSRRLLH